ncbi:hypothetical protein PG984_012079 [Apiospora sp. TS-2023a]
MSEYTSTHEGFQRAMERSLTGPPEEAEDYVKSITLPTFYQITDGHRRTYDDYFQHIAKRRAQVSKFKPVLHEFLRDGDQLAARMTGTVKLDGPAIEFESFMFAKVDPESGKLVWLMERLASSPARAIPDHGAH